jgi:peptidylprolyl isomerase
MRNSVDIRILGIIALSLSLACDDSSSEPEAEYVITPSGLQYLDIEIGSGRQPRYADFTTVHYTMWLEDGTKIDSSYDRGQPFEFNIGLGQVIAGWEEGIASMRVGGRRKLVIPPELAYGDGGYPPVIPPNAVLVSEVALLMVQGSENIAQ